MISQRNPKKHPKAGDVLRRFGVTRQVTAVAKKASGTLLTVYFRTGNADSQTASVSISSWRGWANANCEVILQDDTDADSFIPRMLIATHRCGGLVASSWDDGDLNEENQRNCLEWRAKGYLVRKINVPSNAPMMAWCECNRGEQP